MKKYNSVWRLLLLIGPLVQAPAYGQQSTNAKPVTAEEVKKQPIAAERLEAGYQTPITGWVVRPGDTLQLGRGSLPNKAFAFLYQNTASFTSVPTDRKYLQSVYAGRKVLLKSIGTNGTRATGFGVYGVVGTGELIRYYAEIDNAIEAGEILPPVRYRPSAQASPAMPVSVADELIKLKSLLDNGIITQQEFDVQKKKLLN